VAISNERKNSMHYGWLVVFGGFLTQIILMCGVQFVPILMAQIKTSLQLTNATAGTIISVFGLFYAGCSFFWGYIADRFGARIAVSISGLILGIFVIAFGLAADSFSKAVIIIALVGFGAAGVYSATIPKLIGAWFHPSKRGRAMSLITPGGVLTGASFGIMLPRLAKAYGWQTTAIILGVLAILCTVVIYWVVRNRPSEKGLTPVGSPIDEIVDNTPPAKEGSFKEVLKMRNTWHVSIMFIFWQIAFMTGTAFVAVSFVNAGFTAVQGGMAVTVYNLCQLVGQQIWGPLSDRLERKTVIGMAAIWWVAATLGYVLVYGSTLNMMYFMIALMGVGMGMVPVILASFSDYFPKEVRGTGAGTVSTLGLVGRFFGPMLAGMIADATGSITGAFGFGAAAMLIAGIIAFTLPGLKNTVVVKGSSETV
jgi:MFS family permease